MNSKIEQDQGKKTRGQSTATARAELRKTAGTEVYGESVSANDCCTAPSGEFDH